MMDTLQPRRRRQLLTWLLALAVGGLGVWLQHRHQFASKFDLFPAPRGDSRLTVYQVEHLYQSLLGNAELLSPAMFYPIKHTLAHLDLLVLFAPPYSVLRASGFDTFTALALTIMVFSYLNFISGFFLLNSVFRFNTVASCAGAMFLAFNNPKLAQADHLQLHPVWLLPLIVACVVHFARRGSTLTEGKAFALLAFAAILFNVQLLTSFYLGWFFSFWSLIFFGLGFCFPASRRFLMELLRARWRSVIAAGLVFVIGFALFLWFYLPGLHSEGGWSYDLALRYTPDWRSPLLMADGNFVWNRATQAILSISGSNGDWGRRIGIGLVPTVAWLLISLVALRDIKRRNSTVLFLDLLILAVNLFCVIGFQIYGHSLWHFVFRLVPGGNAIRATARYVIFLALPMSIAFAFAADRAQQRFKSPITQVLIFLTIAFGLFEQFNSGNDAHYSIRTERERLARLSAKLPDGCAAFYVTANWPADTPMDSFQNQQWMHDAVLISMMRGVPTLNGRSGKSPPGWDLREVTAPGYETKVRDWIVRHNINGKICQLHLDE